MPIQAFLRKSTYLEDYETILELLDKPAFIWDKDQDQVLSCNSIFLLFSGYSRNKIKGLAVENIFPGIRLNRGLIESQLTRIRLANSQFLDVAITSTGLKGDEKYCIITILEQHQKPDENVVTASGINLDAIGRLLAAPLATDLATAIQESFTAGQNLISCDHLAIYLPIPGSDKNMILMNGLGDYDYLPNIIKIEEIQHLSVPLVWQLGNRTNSILHQSALTAHRSYLATCPLNSASPLQGLLVIGSKSNLAPQQLLPLISMLARTINASIEINQVLTTFREELQENKYQLEIIRNIRNQISEGIIFIDSDYTIIDLNSSASLILGYRESEMLNQPIEKVMVCDGNISEIIKQGEEGDLLVRDLNETDIMRRDGVSIPVLIRSIPLVSDLGPNTTAILFSDLSTLRQYETRSRQLETQANLGEMIAVFAHEIRNPINNIRMGVENFSTYFEDEETGEEIDRILNDVDRLSDLMKSILTAYRTKEYQMESINIHAFLESIVFRWKPRMTRYSVIPSIEVDDTDGLITGDKRSLEQVFTNVIQNAIDAMKDGGGELMIRITTQEYEDAVRVDVADTGPGIPADIREKIFNLYYTTRQNGNGIGLAITKQIVDAHNGEITVNSVPGGTVFRIILPKPKKSNHSEEVA